MMNIHISIEGPVPRGTDLIGLKEALTYVLETYRLTVDRVDIEDDVIEAVIDDKLRKKIKKLEMEYADLKRQYFERRSEDQ